MIIGVAGPYSADTAEQRQANLDAMNHAAAKLLELGHIPVIGTCEGLLLLKESPGPIKSVTLYFQKACLCLIQ